MSDRLAFHAVFSYPILTPKAVTLCLFPIEWGVFVSTVGTADLSSISVSIG